ncbi:MAG: flagellar motor protein [Oscillospiraceae bacterium]|nr:flagellar motor protein [Oscillospiraceae bacterium]
MEAILFVIFAFASLIGAFLLEGGHIAGLWGPTALLIVLGGTIGATGFSIRGINLKNTIKCITIAFTGRKSSARKTAAYLTELAQKARKDGVLALEPEAENKSLDKFIRDGLLLVVDGTDAEKLRETMEVQIEQIQARHKANIAIFESAGGYAPTMGIIGTVMGLVHVLGNLDDPNSLGPKIAVAFLATLYGISTANLLYLPIATKLKAISAAEINEKYMIIEGLASIANIESPTMISTKLTSFIEDKKERAASNIGKLK